MTDVRTHAAESRFADRPLGELATALPGATALFRAQKLDYCCGGRTSLREAAAAKGLDLGALTARLAQFEESGPAPEAPLETGALIGFIVTRYHEAHRRELPELIKLAERVEAVHRGRSDFPAGLAELLKKILGELTMHMQKEELILFPRMRRGGGARLSEPIAAMLADHDDHAAHLRALEALTGDFSVPEGACTTWRALYAGLRKFADDLVDHIAAENNVLFPRFKS